MPNILLDDKEMPAMQLIQAAKDEGYQDESGQYFLSVAMMHLYAKGHSIKEAPEHNCIDCGRVIEGGAYCDICEAIHSGRREREDTIRLFQDAEEI